MCRYYNFYNYILREYLTIGERYTIVVIYPLGYILNGAVVQHLAARTGHGDPTWSIMCRFIICKILREHVTPGLRYITVVRYPLAYVPYGRIVQHLSYENRSW